MRIISGKYKGKEVLGYQLEGTRPTQDRVKESLFAMIQNEVGEAKVLDLFAGTGNLGLEALSNGARHCTFVDDNPKAVQTIKKNMDNLNIPTNQNKVILSDYQAFLNQDKESYDVIFLDPPHRYTFLPELLKELVTKGKITPGGIVVCEYEQGNLEEQIQDLIQIKDRKYGYKRITIYKREED